MKKYQKIVDKAISLLEKWQEYENAMRNYEHENWHCVNVKRYDDHLSDDEIMSLAKKVSIIPLYQSKLVDMYKKDMDNFEYNIYYSWLNYQWEMLNEDIYHCDELKNGLNYLSSDNWCKKPILSLGRSGGWACFQMTIDKNVDEINYILSVNTNEDNQLVDEYDRYAIEDLKTYCDELKEGMEEIDKIKGYISSYNDNLDFKGEVLYRMEDWLQEIKQEEIDEQKEKEKIGKDYIEKLTKSKNDKVSRLAKGLLKIL